MTPADFFRQCGLPRLEARLLVQHVCGFTAVQCLTRDGETLPTVQVRDLQALAARRLAGEPLPYILGWREFYGRRFAVSPATLIPRAETEHLVDGVLARLPSSGRVWDLGTGSGAVAVSVALAQPDAYVLATDVSEAALVLARQNARDWGAVVDFAAGSWFAAGQTAGLAKGEFDVLVANPPYIAADDGHLQRGDLRFEPQNALTDFGDGLSCIRILAEQGMAWLKVGGCLLVEHGYRQGQDCRDIFAAAGWQRIETLPDLAGLERITLGYRLDGGCAG